MVTKADSARCPLRMTSMERVPCCSHAEESARENSTLDHMNFSLQTEGYQLKVGGAVHWWEEKIHQWMVYPTCGRGPCCPKDPTLWTPGCLRETRCWDWWHRLCFFYSGLFGRSAETQTPLGKRKKVFPILTRVGLEIKLILTCSNVFQVTKVGLTNNGKYNLLFSALSILSLQLPGRHKDPKSPISKAFCSPQREQPHKFRRGIIQRFDLKQSCVVVGCCL